jgi:hypothetical protein
MYKILSSEYHSIRFFSTNRQNKYNSFGQSTLKYIWRIKYEPILHLSQ